MYVQVTARTFETNATHWFFLKELMIHYPVQLISGCIGACPLLFHRMAPSLFQLHRKDGFTSETYHDPTGGAASTISTQQYSVRGNRFRMSNTARLFVKPSAIPGSVPVRAARL